MPCLLACGGADGQDQDVNAIDAMVGPPSEARSSISRRPSTATAAPTPWLWLPVALSSMLLVLFVVVVNRQQAQAERIGTLLGRVRTLEQSRALERTAVLEQQLRSMLTRLQDLEKGERQLQEQQQQLLSLQADLQSLRRTTGRVMTPLEEPPTAPPPPPPPPRSPRPGVDPSDSP